MNKTPILAGCVCALIGLTGAVTRASAGEPVSGSAVQSVQSDAVEVTVPVRNYSIFYDQGDHLEDLIKAGEYEQASALYRNHQSAFFDSRKDKFAPMLAGLAAKLNEAYQPRLDAARVALPAKASMDPSGWPAARGAVTTARQVLEAFARHEAVFSGGRTAPARDALAQGLHDTKAAWRSVALAAIGQYDPGRNFFAAYPVEIENHASFLAEAYPRIEGNLRAGGRAAVLGFASTYKDDLAVAAGENTATPFARLSNLYVELSLNAAPAGADRLKTALLAVADAKKQGLAPTEVPGLTIAFAETTSQTLLKEGQIEFPVAINVDLPFKTVKTTLEQAMSGGATYDYVVALEVSMAKTQQRIQRVDQVSSRYLSGHRDVPNPAYEPARMRVFQAQSAVSSNQNQYCYSYGCLGKAIAGIALAVGLKSANDTFAQTPQSLTEEVFQDYQFRASDMDARKTVTANYYVVDTQRQNYFKSTFDVGEDKHFRIVYNLNDKDTNRDTHLKQYDSEESAKRFEDAPVTVRLSDVLAQFAAKGGDGRSFKSLAVLRDDMLRDKNTALVAHRQRTQDQTASTQDDARFESVVVILNPKGELGAGFYVQPDLVLTNYHVIEGTQFVELKLHNGLETFGKVVKSDARLDLALVRCQARGRPVQFYSGAIPLGSTVEAIGHPKGLEFSITRGVVSALRKQPSPMGVGGKEVLFVQTDTPINPGNSGGPLFLNNQVVAVNDNKFVSKGVEGIGFAVHYTEIMDFLKEGF